MSAHDPSFSSGPRATILGKIIIFLFVAACGYGAWRLYVQDHPPSKTSGSSSESVVPR